MNEQEILAEIERIWKALPARCDELITDIDRFIFGAQQGFNRCTDLLIIYSDRESQASVTFKKALAYQFKVAEVKQIASTSRKEWATVYSVDEECALTAARQDVHRADLMRDKWMETLNTYKKIKNDNSMIRGGGH